MILVGIFIYFIIELIYYIKYRIQYKILNNFRNIENVDRNLSKRQIEIVIDEMRHVKNIKGHVLDLFYNNINHEEIPRKLIHDITSQHLYFPFHNDLDHQQLHHINSVIDYYEHKLGIKFSENNYDISSSYIKWGENDIKSWYKPIIITITSNIVKLSSDYILRNNGFNNIKFSNGFKIWYRYGTINKSSAKVFIHSSLGGLLIYKNFIKQLSTETTIILPEIPGISFGNNVFIPPTIYKMTEQIIDFIKDNNIKEFDMCAHSFGCNFIACVINRFQEELFKYDIKIKKTIIIEGIVFIPRIMNIYKFFNDNALSTIISSIKAGDYGDLISVFFFYRDIYLQYYTQRCVSATDSILLGNTEYEKTGEIHLILAENDNKMLTDDLLHYLDSKKMNCNIKVFENKIHGDFALNSDMQNYVLNLFK